MKKRIKIISAIIFFILGLSLFIYPYITDKQYKSNISKKEKEYITYVEKIQNLPIPTTEEETN